MWPCKWKLKLSVGGCLIAHHKLHYKDNSGYQPNELVSDSLVLCDFCLVSQFTTLSWYIYIYIYDKDECQALWYSIETLFLYEKGKCMIYQVEMNVMSDFLNKCFRQYLIKYCLSLSFRNDTLSNSYLFLSDYKNIVHNLQGYSPRVHPN